ncbi:hypothetical protein DSO57_1021098 [Entomophthora muscae]|uniref:Uncharacterized protein n=1 Tax=Entomophthora muscae TaxID=34485 RepID=A0ACC2UD22_9FUNG|nr:hypothetical protein DSO57_1021098 [Entomophthora muscae]
MKEIPTTPPLPNAPPAQDFSKLGFIYITVLELANQVVPHTGSWRPLATPVNCLVRIVLIVYMAFQARPASPVGVQPTLAWAVTLKAPSSRTPSLAAWAQPASPCSCHPATQTVGLFTLAGWGNCQIGKPKKAISPNPNLGESAVKIWNLPNLDGADRLPCKFTNAVIVEVEFGCMTVLEETPNQCKSEISTLLLATSLQSHSQKGILDSTKCLGFPVQCFSLFMPH